MSVCWMPKLYTKVYDIINIKTRFNCTRIVMTIKGDFNIDLPEQNMMSQEFLDNILENGYTSCFSKLPLDHLIKISKIKVLH